MLPARWALLALLPLLSVVACGDQTAAPSPLLGSWTLVGSDGRIADVTPRPSDAPLVGPVPIGDIRDHLFPAPGATLKVSEIMGTSSLRYATAPCDVDLDATPTGATLIPGTSCTFEWVVSWAPLGSDRYVSVFTPSSLTLTLDGEDRLLEEAAGPCRFALRFEEGDNIVVNQTFDCTLARTFVWARSEDVP